MPIPLPSSFFAVFYLIWNEKKNQAEKKEKILIPGCSIVVLPQRIYLFFSI